MDHVDQIHDDVIKWKHFPRYWPFVRGIHRSPVNSPHKGQWRGALMFTLICARINGWVNNREAGDLRRYCTHYDVIVMKIPILNPTHPFTNLLLSLIPAWIRIHIHRKVWHEITYPFPNVNGCTVEVWEWMIDLISDLTMHVNIYPWWIKSNPCW